MNIDKIKKDVESLQQENRALRDKNIELILQIRRLRESLASTLNVLDPDQLRIISRDISDLNFVNNIQNAQS